DGERARCRKGGGPRPSKAKSQASVAPRLTGATPGRPRCRRCGCGHRGREGGLPRRFRRRAGTRRSAAVACAGRPGSEIDRAAAASPAARLSRRCRVPGERSPARRLEQNKHTEVARSEVSIPPPYPPPQAGGGKFQRWHEPFLRRSDGGSGRRERLLREVEAIGHVVGGLVARVDRRQAECLLAKLDEADVGVLGV